MRQTKESNKRAPGRVVIYTLTFSNVLLVLALNLIVHKSSYCKCSLASCQARTFLLFAIWTHPLQMREYPLQYASTDKNKKSHYNCLGKIHTFMNLGAVPSSQCRLIHVYIETVMSYFVPKTFLQSSCQILQWYQFRLIKGLFILHRNCVALPHCTILHRTWVDCIVVSPES